MLPYTLRELYNVGAFEQTKPPVPVLTPATAVAACVILAMEILEMLEPSPTWVPVIWPVVVKVADPISRAEVPMRPGVVPVRLVAVATTPDILEALTVSIMASFMDPAGRETVPVEDTWRLLVVKVPEFEKVPTFVKVPAGSIDT